MTPLHNTRILDLTRLLPGAVATMLLHDLGAEIIKVEDPHTGDYARLMPPLIDGMGAFFRSSNAGKKSLAINLKSPQGQAILHRLVTTADVLIEGFRPGVTARLAADCDTLRAINPRLVYCSLSGWGQSGPYAPLSGHDLNYIARNGVLGAGLQPATPGAQVADVSGAYVAVMGILAALLKRHATGAGDYLDVALSEAAMPLALAAWVEAQTTPLDEGFVSLRGESACYRLYYCADGEPVALAAVEAKFWTSFCRAVEKPEWIAQQYERSRQPVLINEVAALFKSKRADEWSARLANADCCFSRVVTPHQLLNDPQIAARRMAGVDAAGVPWMRSPIRLSGGSVARQPAPAHGEHTVKMLAEMGYSTGEIERLLEANIIRQAP